MPILAQAIGIVAMCFNISSYQFKNKRNVLLFQLISSVLFSVNMFMLGATMGGILNAIGVIRAFVFLYRDRIQPHLKAINLSFMLVYILSYVLLFTVLGKEPTAKNLIIELLPLIGMGAMTIGFSGTNAKAIRIYGFISSPCWLTYNCFNFAIGAILCEAFAIVSNLLAFIRLDLKKKATDKTEEVQS